MRCTLRLQILVLILRISTTSYRPAAFRSVIAADWSVVTFQHIHLTHSAFGWKALPHVSWPLTGLHPGKRKHWSVLTSGSLWHIGFFPKILYEVIGCGFTFCWLLFIIICDNGSHCLCSLNLAWYGFHCLCSLNLS